MNAIRKLMLFVASGAGIGWLPGGGTIVALPMAFLMIRYQGIIAPFLNGDKLKLFVIFFVVTAIIAGGLFSLVEDTYRRRIVVDHAWGMILALLLAPLTWKTVIVGFVLFRFFDIIKPWPVYHFSNIPNGFGVILDDIVSGLLSAASLHGIIIAYKFMMSYL